MSILVAWDTKCKTSIFHLSVQTALFPKKLNCYWKRLNRYPLLDENIQKHKKQTEENCIRTFGRNSIGWMKLLDQVRRMSSRGT